MRTIKNMQPILARNMPLIILFKYNRLVIFHLKYAQMKFKR